LGGPSFGKGRTFLFMLKGALLRKSFSCQESPPWALNRPT